MNKTRKICLGQNGVKKLMGCALCGLLLSAAGPPVSTGTETLHCEYKFLSGSNKGGDGESKIEISGNVLKRFVESPVPFLPKPKISYIVTDYKILEQNKVGVVAVTPDALVAPNIGPVLGVQVLTIRKLDGAFRIGSAGSTGVYDQSAGRCK
jgi:hypothetical protein